MLVNRLGYFIILLLYFFVICVHKNLLVMSGTWTSEETFKFIELYQSEPAIWNPKYKAHKDKYKVNDAWNRISDEMGVPVSEIKKKKETLLAAFRLNHKKVIASLKPGAREDEIFKPIWIYYDALAAFMADVYECKSISNTEDVVSASDNQPEAEEVDSIEQLLDMQCSRDGLEGNSSQRVGSTFVRRKRRCTQPPELAETTNDHVKNALSTVNTVLYSKQTNESDDECDLFGRLLAKKLRKFNEIDRQQLMYDIDGLLLMKTHSTSSKQYVVSPSRPQPQVVYDNRPSGSRNQYSHAQDMVDNRHSSPSPANSVDYIPLSAYNGGATSHLQSQEAYQQSEGNSDEKSLFKCRTKDK